MAELKPSFFPTELAAIKQTVCVTGVTGYVAGTLVQRLLAIGHTVHATCRSPDNLGAVQHLTALPHAAERLTLFKADLLEQGSFDEAVQGCSIVFHTASPFVTYVRSSEARQKLIEPAVKGTENVLGSVQRCSSVSRVVLTSSTGAITTRGDEHGIDHIATEADWTKVASETYNPYNKSKELAERRAWELADAQDRYITTCGSYDISDLVGIAHSLYPQHIGKPRFTLPKALMWLVGPLGGLQWDAVSALVGQKQHFSNHKVQEELGMTWLPIEETLRDMAKSLSTHKLIKPLSA